MRGFGTVQLLALGVGTIVGVGWIVAVGDWIAQAGAVGAMVAFGIGAVAVSVIAACYGDAIGGLSRKGGEVPIVGAALGEDGAFTTGCALMVAYLGAIVFEAAALGWILEEIAKSLGYSWGHAILAAQIGAIALFTMINSRGSRAVGGVQSALAAIKVFGFIAMVACGFIFGSAATLGGGAQATMHVQFDAVLSLAATTPFWFAGFNVIAQASSERAANMSIANVARTMVVSVLVAGVLYVSMIAAVGSLVDPHELKSLSLPAADSFAMALGSSWAKVAVLVVGMTGILAAWNAMTFATARVVQATFETESRSGETFLGGFLDFGLAAAAFAGMFGAAAGRAAMSPAISASAAALCFVFALVSVAVLRTVVDAGGRGRSIARPILSLVISSGMLLMLLHSALTAKTLPFEWVVLGAIGLLCALVRIAHRRRPRAGTCSED